MAPFSEANGRLGEGGEVGSIRIPSTDKRTYRPLCLANGLQALLISDPETDKAAAAMSVNVGHYSDPDQLPGLAHFLEHMLFFASEKYPQEDSYSRFLSEHGGRTNAYTSAEETNFQLDVNWEYFEEALDRFAQFFICPLLSADATDREIKAVDSENSKNLTSDPWRMNQLRKSLSDPKHPYFKFGTGSLFTLGENPKQLGIDTRQQLLSFYSQHYSANVMRLVVYARQSVDELQTMVEAKFTAVVNKALSPIRFHGQPCSQKYLQLLVKAVPVTENQTLELTWPIPPSRGEHQKAAARFLGHLIGHEAEGSIFAELKKRGWATSLCAGEMDGSWHFNFFSVSIELTEAGHEHVDEIMALVFEYIGLILRDGIQEWLYNELRDVCATMFDFMDKKPPFSFVTSIASNMQIYPQADWVSASSLPHRYDPIAIRQVAESLTPSSLRMFWLSKKFESLASDSEKWYSTKHKETPLPADWIQKWQAALSSVPSSSLSLPLPNEFIPTDFSILYPNMPHPQVPEVLLDEKMLRVWHKKDSLFALPKAVVILNIACPASYTSPDAAVLTRLFAKLLQDELNEYAYYAEIAGLGYDVQVVVSGLQVCVWGYSHKLLLLVRKIIEKMSSLSVREDRFQLIKDKLLKDFLNFKYEQPYQQALYSASVLLEYKRWHMLDYIEVIPHLTHSSLSAFIPSLFSRCFLELFVSGNLSQDSANSFGHEALNLLQAAGSLPLLPSMSADLRVVEVSPASPVVLTSPGLNPDDPNNALLFYLQNGPDDVHRNVLNQLLIQTLQRDTFHQLRTVEQLGYITVLMARTDKSVHGLAFIIQSHVQPPAFLEARVEEFLSSCEAKLKDLSEDAFKMHVDALIALKEEKFKSLVEETHTVWKEIDEGTLMFDRVKQEVAALRKLERAHLLDFFSSCIKKNSPLRRKLSIHVRSGQVKDGGDMTEKTLDDFGEQIRDVFKYKRSQPLYGSFKNGKGKLV